MKNITQKQRKKLQVINIPIEKLKFAEYNPRKANAKEIQDLKESLERFGFVEPIVVNSAPKRKNIIIGGHFRTRMAKELGIKEVPVVYINIPDIKKEQELNLRLNKNLGSWDYDLLANFDETLLEEVGFDSEEIDSIFDLEVEEDEFDAQREYEKIKEPKAKPGDIYQLGNHKLICGDSTQLETWQKLFGQEKARLIWTDPPFNVGYDYWGFRKNDNFRKRQKGKRWGKEVFSDKKTDEQYTKFIYDFMANAYIFSEDDTTFYCYYGTKNESLVRAGIEQAGWHISQTLIWLKPTLVISPGQDYHRIYEPCYLGWKKGKKHFVNKKWGFKYSELINLDQDTFEEYLDVLYEKRDTATIDYLHPTQKPVRLAERGIRRHSERGNIIAEPFAGSGSTLIAAEQMKRRCYAIELDPKFIDVIVKRWEIFTHKKAKKLE